MPEFDPNQYLQSSGEPEEEFDPDEYLKGPKEASFTEMQSGLLGAAQGASLGFADELEGAVKAGYEKLTDLDKQDFTKQYGKHRDVARSRYEKASRENPKSFMAGEVGGGVATALVPGLGGASVGKMAAMGGLQAAGLSKAEPLKNPEGLGQFAKDVAGGAALGGAAQYGISKLDKLAPYLKKVAEQRAVKAATGQNKRVIKEAVKSGRLQQMGRHLLEDEDPVISLISKSETIAPKLADKQAKIGAQIGEIAKEIDTVAPQAVDGKAISQRILDEAAKIPDLPQTRGVQQRMLDTAAQFEKMGNIDFKQAQLLKNQFKVSAMDHTQEATMKSASNAMYGAVKDQMDDAAQMIAEMHPEERVRNLLGQYKTLKDKYGTYKVLNQAAKDQEAANISNRFVSPSDYGLGIGAGTVAAITGATMPHAALLAAGGAVVNKVGRQYGSAFAAKSLNKIANMIQSTPEKLGRYAPMLKKAMDQGGSTLAATHQLLMLKDPGYQKIVMEGQQ